MTLLAAGAQIAGLLFGSVLQVMGKVANLRKKYPTESPASIYKIFRSEEWDVAIVSACVDAMAFVSFYLGGYEWLEKKTKGNFTELAAMLCMVVIAYAGQRLVYKYLGTAEAVLSEKANFNNKLPDNVQ